jgi:hypothetical protein
MKSRQEKVEKKRNELDSHPQNANSIIAKSMQQPFKKSIELVEAVGGEFAWLCTSPEFNFAYYSCDPTKIVKTIPETPRIVIIDSPERDFITDLMNSPKLAFPSIRDLTENYKKDYNMV